jgi:predicted component of type VI protein secretion system
MTQTATITISSGPDRGREFPVDEELINIGRGEGNEIRLSDDGIPEHQATIVRRNGRYAICATEEQSVEVDGSLIPRQRWVWLPEAARVRVSPRSVLLFRVLETAEPDPPAGRAEPRELSTPAAPSAAARPAPAAPVHLKPPLPVPGPSAKRSRGEAALSKRPDRVQRQVARFITDAPGEPLVRLGEDGHLPELALAEGSTRPRRASERAQGSPAAVYAAVACSVLLSLILLLVPEGGSGPSVREQATARLEIEQFYERRGGELEVWQRLLREARLAQGRGDSDAARRNLRRVLEMLNSEEFLQPGAPTVGALPSLTDDRKTDQRLRELIAVLLEE